MAPMAMHQQRFRKRMWLFRRHRLIIYPFHLPLQPVFRTSQQRRLAPTQSSLCQRQDPERIMEREEKLEKQQ